jgi:hypothetical protein
LSAWIAGSPNNLDSGYKFPMRRMNEALPCRNLVISSRNITCVTFHFPIKRLVFVAQLHTRKIFTVSEITDATATLTAVFGRS